MEIDIKAELVRLAEPEYAVFSRRLLPGTENVLGVRLPLLRRLARRIAKGDWACLLYTSCFKSKTHRSLLFVIFKKFRNKKVHLDGRGPGTALMA